MSVFDKPDKVKELTEWANILLTTDLKQIQFSLCRDGGYCCIGVYGKEVLRVSDSYMRSVTMDVVYQKIKDLSEISTVYFHSLNDHYDWTFKKIGQYILDSIEAKEWIDPAKYKYNLSE